MNPEQLQEMNSINWWHQMELGGATTNGKDLSQWKLSVIDMPKDLKGRSVIDVGAWDGFFSFEAERRGANVLAIDTNEWNEFTDEHGRLHTGKKGFDFAHKILNSKVGSEEIEVMDLNKHGRMGADLVLCLGILYHMKDPFGMCKVMYDITADDGMCILETHTDLENANVPMMAFYPNNECNNDSSNWFGPNPHAVIAMLKAAGFDEVEMVFFDMRIHRGVFHAWRKKK